MVSTVDTAPHIVDPKNPGAVDEIIHLGDYWHERKMRENKEAILHLNREVERLFRRAYGYLAQAKILHDEIESYYVDSGALDIAGLNRVAREIVEDIFNGSALDTAPPERHLFASAITPEGAVNYMETIFGDLNQRIILSGPAGTGKSTIVKKLYNEVVNRGYTVEAYHCSLKPGEIEHLVIEPLGVGVITSEPPHIYKAAPGDKVINTLELVNNTALQPFAGDLEEAKRRYQEAFTRAVAFINRAKKAHDEMEQYYIPNIDFERVNACRKTIVARIYSYAGELRK